MQKTIYWFIAAIVVAVIVVVIALALRGYRQTPSTITNQPPQQSSPVATSEPAVDTRQDLSTSEEALTINMEAGNLFFSPNTISVKKDQKVKVNFSVTGTHTFTINELGVNERLSSGSETAEFTPTKSGSFEYYCAIPGHREGGMFGGLSVQ